MPPNLSVVVAAWTGREALRCCLNSLFSQTRPDEDEIIVARNFLMDPEASLRMEFPSVIDLPLPPDTTVPQLRGAALAVATGAVVAFIEDHCECVQGWRDAIVRAHELPFPAVGGPVDLGIGGRALDWAVYFYDYSRFAPPMRSGPVGSLSGANASYKHAFLADAGPALQNGVIEVILEREIRERHLAMYLASEAVVVHRKRHLAAHAIGLSLALARGYASERLKGQGVLRRLAFASVTPLLPLLLVTRVLMAVVRTRRHVMQFAMAFPWLLVLLGAWSFGELQGYLAGEGASQLRWR